jgi:tetratricopeptide (TPR) repeat protein
MLWQYVDYDDLARFCMAGGKYASAIAACNIGLGLQGGNPGLLVRRAQAHDALENYGAAIADCRQALRLSPPAHIGALAEMTLALALESIDQTAAALDAARAAIALAPNERLPHCAYANLLGWHGQLTAAWPEIECHWIEERAAFQRRFQTAEWDGESIIGRRVLVVHGQGLGDMIQMARYLPRLRARAAHVTLECPPTLEPLFRTLSGIDLIVKPGSVEPNAFDVFLRMMSLPRLLGETGSPEGNAPYLRVPAEHLARWRKPARIDGALRVGLVWAGNPFHPLDRWRSLFLTDCEPLSEVRGVRWTSLQVGPRAAEAAGSGHWLERCDREIFDFADTAAIIAQLDLVIAVDTAVAHLAGALGVPVWLLLRPRPDWRWLRKEHITPWYRSMRLFHARRREWSGVIEQVASRLREMTED